jgi:hypothetical protein
MMTCSIPYSCHANCFQRKKKWNDNDDATTRGVDESIVVLRLVIYQL